MASTVLEEVRALVGKELQKYSNTELKQDQLKADTPEHEQFLNEWLALHKQGRNAHEKIFQFLETKATTFDQLFGPMAFLLRNLLFARTILPEQPKLKERKNVEPLNLKDGLLNGLEVWYYPNSNQKMSEWVWEAGQRQGEEVGWHRNGQVAFIRNRTNGKLDGEERRWHENGVLAHHYTWDVTTGTIKGLDRGWYDNGQASYIRTYVENSWLDGEDKRWWPNGKQKMQRTWVRGKENGEELWWHENGQLHIRRRWEMGMKEGLEEVFEPDGSLKEKSMWVKGDRQETPEEKGKKQKQAEKDNKNAAPAGGSKQAKNQQPKNQQPKKQKNKA